MPTSVLVTFLLSVIKYHDLKRKSLFGFMVPEGSIVLGRHDSRKLRGHMITYEHEAKKEDRK